MRDYMADAAPLCRSLTVRSDRLPSGRRVSGCLRPIDPDDTERLKAPAAPGRINDERYLLIVPADALAEADTGVTVTAGSRVYDLLRFEPVYVGGRVGHWEGVLRLKGGVT